MTDTGGFRHANASPAVFALAAFLESHGASIHRLRESLEKNWSLARMKLWGKMSERLTLEQEDKLAMCILPLDLLERYGCKSEDTEGFVEHMRELRSVRIACFLREQNLDVCKFSLRSVEDMDVNAIASSLGGGGHRNAAGGTLAMSLERASELFATHHCPKPRIARSLDFFCWFKMQKRLFAHLAAFDFCTKCPYRSSPMPSSTQTMQIPAQQHGVLVLNKPSGPTSNRCLSVLKRLGQKKIGHAGTLDPMADGVLLLLLGAATRISNYLLEAGCKVYSATARLGL